MYRYVFFLASVLLSNAFSHSQEVISSDGNFIAGSGGSLSWTLGEMISETFENQTLYLTQGFQQPDLGSLGSSSLLLNNDISIYPNPFTTFINLSSKSINSTFILKMYDSQLRLVLEMEFFFHSENNPVVIPLSNFPNGLYILSMSNRNCTELFHKRIIKI